MDTWLDTEEVDKLIQELNPHLQTGIQLDTNWQKLKLERKPRYDFDKTVKSQSPTVMLFENNQGFVYRRWDGAHWHTELRDIDEGTAFTASQRRLKDAIDTLQALTQNLNLKWITPLNKQSDSYDPRYQLVTQGDRWYCLIDNKLYEESNRRQQTGKTYTEITFSTRNKPIFDIDTINQLLDKLI